MRSDSKLEICLLALRGEDYGKQRKTTIDTVQLALAPLIPIDTLYGGEKAALPMCCVQ
jgi:hypothetical protein